jgi:hypothetical protein
MIMTSQDSQLQYLNTSVHPRLYYPLIRESSYRLVVYDQEIRFLSGQLAEQHSQNNIMVL